VSAKPEVDDSATPLVSIVMPTRESAGVVQRALDSLAAQTLRDFELVVCDGLSEDGTVAIVQAMAPVLPHLDCTSQRDGGVYEAINRGIGRARGQWVLVLGSDDCLHGPDTLARIAPHLNEAARGDSAIVYGDVRMMGENLCGVAPLGRYAGPLPLARLLVTNICQQAIFYRRTLFDRLGGFDTRYRLHADWHFNLRAAFEVPMTWVDMVIADYATTGMSSSTLDQAFAADFGGFVRGELLKRPRDARLQPLQRHLLRRADALRRRGQWREALAEWGTWLRLRLAQI
jgi:glycosyltransferase involved in cell wall biosynthesis